jgi:preprotein translocase subunit SecG
MYIFVLTLHIILCILLTILILMQPGKGADVSSAFGGGAASQLFGASGPGNFLTRGTGMLAALFMVTSVTLALYSTSGSGALDDLKDENLGEEGAGFGNSAPPPAENSLPPLPGTPGPGPTPNGGVVPPDMLPPGGAPGQPPGAPGQPPGAPPPADGAAAPAPAGAPPAEPAAPAAPAAPAGTP